MFKKRSTTELLGKIEKTLGAESAAPKAKKVKSKTHFSIGRLFKNRATLAGFCIIVAMVFSFVVMPIVQAYISQSIEVVRLSADVKLGERLSADKLEIATVGGLNVAADAITSMAQAIDKYAKIDMLAGDILGEKKISAETITDDKYLLTLPEGMLALSVSIDGLAESVSGKLRTGDIVRVFAKVDDSNSDVKSITPAELQYVEVLAVTNGNIRDIGNGTKDNPDMESSDKQIATITLAVNGRQALALTALGGTVHTALVYRGEDEAKAEMLELQSKYVADLEKGE